MPSDIQVFVRLNEPSVFAGEDLECTITFMNVANIQAETPNPDGGPGKHKRRVSLVEQPGSSSRSRGGVWNTDNPRLAAANFLSARNSATRAHRATASLSISPSTGNSFVSPVAPARGNSFVRPTQKHRRSISIISPGSPDVAEEYEVVQKTQSPQGSSSSSKHRRVSTIQTLPERSAGGRSGSTSSKLARCSCFSIAIDTLLPTAHFPQTYSWKLILIGRLTQDDLAKQLSKIKNGASPHSAHGESRRPSPSFMFPSDPVFSPNEEYVQLLKSGQGTASPTSRQTSHPKSLEPFSRLGKVVSGNSLASSARSSGEFHSLSNHSQETLASEQASMVSERPQFPSARIRQHYRMDSASVRRPETVTLLMGYAQVCATFTLDGSLVDQSPFEVVKRKGFLGGQAGGGVVGVKTPEASSTFFGSFNFNSIGESLGGLLGGAELSSLKEMKSIVSSRAVPLLSTPQSLLFVDLRLAPGQEKTFSFKYTIPQGLPSSHKGKALKVVYNLVIGIQGTPSDREAKAVRQVNVPFRVFSGVNQDGEIFGHDLMQPYVVLNDGAKVELIDSTSQGSGQKPVSGTSSESSTADFLSFVDNLLDKNRRRQSSSGALDAAQLLGKPKNLCQAKYAINRAILFSNQLTGDGDRAVNRFEIARNEKPVAVIVLNRASHRLGETVTATVDFTETRLRCFSLRSTLETTEKINPALALRSATSIARVTRRIYASQFENILFAKRTVFSPFIPVGATPTLLTSGVNLNWALRFEFATVVQMSHHESDEAEEYSLLEEVVRDERGIIEAAVESAECETFEVSIPITVYGDVVTDGPDSEEVVGLPI